VLQPHLYSRTQAFASQMGEALLGADVALVLPIYPSREQPIHGVTSQLIVDAAVRSGQGNVIPCASFAAAMATLDATVQAGDVVVTMGAGSVNELGEAWLAGGRR
jgi:UDP-N-acetylmuramate--alanine ligase